jgi:hypothetical protein
MEMVLLDWTRMGKSYCLAGVVADGTGYRVVRPLPGRNRKSAVRNVGWSPFLMEGHTRWEVFELVAPEAAGSEPPHTEDYWVRSLRPRRCLANVPMRRAILEATAVKQGETLFGAPLSLSRAAASLAPGCGARSLVTALVPSDQIQLAASVRAGALEPDWRASLPVPEMGVRHLAVKDHFLLQQASRSGTNLEQQIQAMNALIRRMGERVAVRLGLSRAFPARDGESASCWLMADGFFSLREPLP